MATAPNQVWSMDITTLRGPRKGAYYKCYVIVDIFSRYVVGWMVAPYETADLAADLVVTTCERQGVTADPPTVHTDRGAPMTARTYIQLLGQLGVTRSYARPYQSNDNPYSEALFRTAKYHHLYPRRFGSLEDAQQWGPMVLRMVQRDVLPLRPWAHASPDCALRPYRSRQSCPSASHERGLRTTPGTLLGWQTTHTDAAKSSMDQQAQTHYLTRSAAKMPDITWNLAYAKVYHFCWHIPRLQHSVPVPFEQERLDSTVLTRSFICTEISHVTHSRSYRILSCCGAVIACHRLRVPPGLTRADPGPARWIPLPPPW